MIIIASLFHRFIQLITLLVVVQVILTYVMDPYAPVRRFVDRIVEPLLAPIRRIVPPLGMADFSPLILIIILQILDMLVSSILSSL